MGRSHWGSLVPRLGPPIASTQNLTKLELKYRIIDNFLIFFSAKLAGIHVKLNFFGDFVDHFS